MSDRDLHIRYLGLNMLLAAARQRGVEDHDAANELDAIWSGGTEYDESDWVDACLWIADCVKSWPKDAAAVKSEAIDAARGAEG
jgi:fructose-specific component phosphotransferase system IIB-like protein